MTTIFTQGAHRYTVTGGAKTMREFFNGWKRKTGVVTLVMACAFMAGWVRSEFICDGITLSSRAFVVVGHGLIVVSDATSTTVAPWGFPDWQQGELDQFDSDMQMMVWQWQLLGFGHGHPPDINEVSTWTVPFWSLAQPFTLLSVYLLLSKPPAAKHSTE